MSAGLSFVDKGRKLAVFTDYEADDSVAIGLLLQHLKQNGVNDLDDVMFGALLSNQYRKKALVQELVGLFGYAKDAVYAGTGGLKEPFEEEGRGILAQEDAAVFARLDQNYLGNSAGDYQDDASILKFREMLVHAPINSVDVVVLTNPIDLVKALDGDLELFHKIKDIYMMGGWFANKSSFNWGISIDSMLELLELMARAQDSCSSPRLTIFSSHMFADQFNGYVNYGKFPDVISAFDSNPHPVVAHLRHMVKNWDDSMTVIKAEHTESDKSWRLAMVDRIGKENIGRQFAPADPATMLGYLYPDDFIVQKQAVSLQLVQQENNGYMVKCLPDASSNIFVVERVNLPFFNDKLLELMQFS